jgi:hypothetical protein
LLLSRQPVFDQREVAILITSVKLVSDDRMAEVRKMDADLMLSTRLWSNPQERKWAWRTARQNHSREAADNFKIGPGADTVGAHAILDGHGAGFILAQGGVDGPALGFNPTVDKRQVTLLDAAILPDFAQLSRNLVSFRDDNYATGFAVETVYQPASG